MRQVTALRSTRPGRVRVELDGEHWRVLPLEAVVRAGLTAGMELDRPRARTLGRELRRLGALDAAGRALARRDRSKAALAAHLAARGVAPADGREALGTLERAGWVDDARFAAGRAAALAARGFGDAAIRFDLERQGVGGETIDEALEALVPEPRRAAEIVAREGETLRVARRLAAKGFASETLESLFS